MILSFKTGSDIVDPFAGFETIHTKNHGSTRLWSNGKTLKVSVSVGSEMMVFNFGSSAPDCLTTFATQIDVLVAFIKACTEQECDATIEERIAQALRKA
jgi:hypothetical protein